MNTRIAKVGAGAAVAAVLASGVAAYYFTKTPGGKKAAQKIKKTSAELGKQISHRVSTAKKITKKYYEGIIDDLVDEYAKQRKIAHATASNLKHDLKQHWKEVNHELKAKPKKVK